ncbi:hypothetical protein EI171_23475 [Bradyrhizobium sp. LCT2]|uniref:hypothetical protein n=1 Tax=Bradyrhizobium sp. LCT2 TaxID=2493093 RepID=UPI00137451F7|nr:hypothetical protein [Bradyrhizobium sp. LCT2]QHP69994.1 hypothetical protein EI171_23475 [Bradyrhizobium sp. LCT2]
MDEQALKVRYAGAMRLLAELLRAQELFIGDIVLVDQDRINPKALGYIYGFADCALQYGRMDIGSKFGLGLMMSLLVEFDDSNADRLWEYLKAPGDAKSLLEGVSLGFDDYATWAESGGTGAPPLRWAKCF